MSIGKSEAISIHNAIHDPNATHITLRDQTIPVEVHSNGCRWVKFLGKSFMEQNKAKESKYTAMARLGKKLTWILPDYGLIMWKVPPYVVADAVLKKLMEQGKKQEGEAADGGGEESVEPPVKKQRIEGSQGPVHIPVGDNDKWTPFVAKSSPLKKTPSPIGPIQTNKNADVDLLLLICFNDQKRKLSIKKNSICDLEQLHVKLKELWELPQDHGISLEYEDKDFNEYMTLENIEQLSNKTKLRILSTSENVPWRFSDSFLKSSGWQDKGLPNMKYRSICVKDNNFVYNQNELESVEMIVKKMHGNNVQISRLYAIENANLLNVFEHYQNKLHNLWRKNPDLFKKDDWKEKNFEWRKWMLDYLTEYIEGYHWNKGRIVPIIPMVHGTKENVVWEIVQNGFSTVSTLDEGWYGKGMYFTSRIDYAMNCYCEPNENGEKALLISYIIPGNVFPVVEHPHYDPASFKGKPFKNGYQSHFTLVNGNGEPSYQKTELDDVFDELVVFQEAQVSGPKYVLFLKAPNSKEN